VARLAEGATHADVEGEDTDALAAWACGPVQPAHTAALRALAMQWLRSTAAAGGGQGVGKGVGPRGEDPRPARLGQQPLP
jgi:hypothetical protein